jgi:hypothetical protein
MGILISFRCEQQILKKMTGYIATVRRQGTLQGSTHYRRPDYSPIVINTTILGIISPFKRIGSRDRLFLIKHATLFGFILQAIQDRKGITADI